MSFFWQAFTGSALFLTRILAILSAAMADQARAMALLEKTPDTNNAKIESHISRS